MTNRTTIEGHAMKTCTTCCRPVASPFRRTDAQGRIVMGCVSAAHDGQLVPYTADATWHNRAAAKAVRRAERAGGYGVAA